MVVYPRWLYRDSDLTQGVIVGDDEAYAVAVSKGFSEYGSATERAPEVIPEPEPAKRKPGRPKKVPA